MSATATAGVQLQFCTDPGEFVTAAQPYLAAAPVVSTVVSTVAQEAMSEQAAGSARRAGVWWLVVRDNRGEVVGAGMRTATFPPYPPFLLPMPDEAAVALGRALDGRGEEVLGLNGALPAVQLCADELVRLGGGGVEVSQRTRLHELGDLVQPAPATGRLVSATDADLDLVDDWFAAFGGDADEQAGRARGASSHQRPDRSQLRRRIRAGLVWFWVDGSGLPVNMTAVTASSFGVARIAPVYTPPDQRGHGFASNAVAAVSRRLRSSGARVCLYTDHANPTSNRVYAALGYRPLVDMADLVIRR
jgi:GNAT superfamily N-acetyltransferase